MCILVTLAAAALAGAAAAQTPPGPVPPAVAAVIGKTFGNGVAGFPLCLEPVTLVNHTLSEGSTHGVLHHFWSPPHPRAVRPISLPHDAAGCWKWLRPRVYHGRSTGGRLVVDRLWVEYFLDGETTPSISFQPSHMCGLAASFLPLYNATDLYNAGAMCGKNSAVGGYFNVSPCSVCDGFVPPA